MNLEELRSAAVAQDHVRVLELAHDRMTDVVQTLGELLLDPPEPLRSEMVAAARARNWVGDQELANLLETGLDAAPEGMRDVPVELEMLTGLLEGDPTRPGGAIDLTTGEVWSAFALEEEGEPEGAELLWCESQGSMDGWVDMELFIGTVRDDELAERLARSLRGSGSFRRYRDVLDDYDRDEFARFMLFSDERRLGRARAWLEGESVRAVPRPAG